MSNNEILKKVKELLLDADSLVKKLTENFDLNESFVYDIYQISRDEIGLKICINQECVVIPSSVDTQVVCKNAFNMLKTAELILEHEEGLRKTHHRMLLEKVYKMDPLIKEAADTLERLSKDPKFVLQYYQREEELKRLKRRSDIHDHEEQ